MVSEVLNRSAFLRTAELLSHNREAHALIVEELLVYNEFVWTLT